MKRSTKDKLEIVALTLGAAVAGVAAFWVIIGIAGLL